MLRSGIRYHMFLWALALMLLSPVTGRGGVTLQPDRKEAAMGWFRTGEFEKALPVFEKLAYDFPYDFLMKYYLGASLVELGDYGITAEKNLVLASGKDVPAKVYYYMGVVNHARNNWNAAQRYYNRFRNHADSLQVKELDIAGLTDLCYRQVNPFAPVEGDSSPVPGTIITAEPVAAVAEPANTAEVPAQDLPSGKVTAADPVPGRITTAEPTPAVTREISTNTEPPVTVTPEISTNTEPPVTVTPEITATAEQSGAVIPVHVTASGEPGGTAAPVNVTASGEPGGAVIPVHATASGESGGVVTPVSTISDMEPGSGAAPLNSASPVLPRFIDFQVTDKVIYIVEDMFQVPEARESFRSGEILRGKLDTLMIETGQMRKAYHATLHPAIRDSIARNIREGEYHTLMLKRDMDHHFRKAATLEQEWWKDAGYAVYETFVQYRDSLKKLQEPAPVVIPEPDLSLFLAPVDTTTAATTAEGALPGEENTVSDQIIYKIQLGAYSGKVPSSRKALFDKISKIRVIEMYENDAGATVYTTGTLTSYDDAMKLQDQVRQEGIKDAFVIGLKNGKRVSLPQQKP